jgi:hypothetical protein
VTRVYLDPGVVDQPAAANAVRGQHVAAPEAVDALNHLADGAHELVLLGRARPRGLDALPIEVRTEPRLPDEPPPGSWLITDDPDGCETRPRGLRTILIGPKRPPSHRPTVRCDLEARDLSAAVIEILAREAMT